MRLSIAFLLLFTIKVISFGQTIVSKVVPMVKESVKIDALLDSAIKLKRAEPGNGCFYIDIYNDPKDKSFWEFDVTGVKTDITKINLGARSLYANIKVVYQDNLRFFYYKGYTIFVAGDSEHFGLFSKTNTFKIFSFVKIAISKSQKMDLFHNLFYTAYYSYDNDTFVSQAVGNR
jgi:hypothetical protein